MNPEPALAVSVTDVPLSKLAVQVEGQLIPAGLLVTLPVPVTETVSWACEGGGGGGGVLLAEPPQPARASNPKEQMAKRSKRTLKTGPEAGSGSLGAKQSSWVARFMKNNFVMICNDQGGHALA